MIKLGNFEFIFGIRGLKFVQRGEEIQEYVAQTRGYFFTFIFGWGNEGVKNHTKMWAIYLWGKHMNFLFATHD